MSATSLQKLLAIRHLRLSLKKLVLNKDVSGLYKTSLVKLAKLINNFQIFFKKSSIIDFFSEFIIQLISVTSLVK